MIEAHVTEADALFKQLRGLPSDGSFVYFIQDGDSIKIGSANDPLSRLEELQIANPRPLRLVAGFQGGRQAEMFLHRWFADYRIRGEWFQADAPGLEAIAALFGTANLTPRSSGCCSVLIVRGRCCRCGARCV